MNDSYNNETVRPEGEYQEEQVSIAETETDNTYEDIMPPPPAMQPWALTLLSLVLGLIAGMVPGVIACALFGRDAHTVDAMFVCIPLGMALFIKIFGSAATKRTVIPIAVLSYVGVFIQIALLNTFHNVFRTVWSGFLNESIYAHLFIVVGLLICFELLPKYVKPELPVFDYDDYDDDDEDEDGELDDDEYEYYYDDDKDSDEEE